MLNQIIDQLDAAAEAIAKLASVLFGIAVIAALVYYIVSL